MLWHCGIRAARKEPAGRAFKGLGKRQHFEVGHNALSVLNTEHLFAVWNPSAVRELCQTGTEHILRYRKPSPALSHPLPDLVLLLV
jgi:hypothetical protein